MQQLAFHRRAQAPTSKRNHPTRAVSARGRRRAFFETLETRNVMAPLGAFPDDTAEFMLGDVLVTVVLMESDPTLPGADPSTENWTAATINAVQQKVTDGMNWWKDTFQNNDSFYFNEDLPLLNFKFDWTWALDPVETKYEPIANYSSVHELWVNDFLGRPDVDFAQSLDIYKDIKAFNNFQREKHSSDWAFTIFVVNSTNDVDDYFPSNPEPAPGEVNYRGAFAFLGGQFLVVPSDRPTTTFAHEVGHMFYALDEYSTGHGYNMKAGYYNTQNTNGAAGNPTENFLSSQEPSIMASGAGQQTAWTQNITSQSSQEMIGWKDSDGDGVMDVLDVPFTLLGSGNYDESSGTYRFKGESEVRTLPNKNTFGGPNTNVVYNDITINKIRRAEYSIDGGAWTTIVDFANTPTSTDLDLSIPVSAGEHTLRIRTFDQRTGASSEIFMATISSPGQPTPPQQSTPGGSVGGYAYRDDNGTGEWNQGEFPLVDWGVELRDLDGNQIVLNHHLQPNDFVESEVLNNKVAGVTLSVIGSTTGGNNTVLARYSNRAGTKVFASTSNETFASIRNPNSAASYMVDRKLRVDFASPVTSVSLRAISAAVSGGPGSVARLEAYDANNNLIARYTTRAMGPGQNELMSIVRETADIKYVIARGHLETEVLLTDLNWGPQTSTTTNPDGSFLLTGLPAGTYQLKVLAAPNYTPIRPHDGTMLVTVPPSGAAQANLYFAYQFGGNPWHNLLDPLNVNADPNITAFDALIIINHLNAHPLQYNLVAGEATPGRYIDTNNDNKVTAFDALRVINFLNKYGAGPSDREFDPDPDAGENSSTGGSGTAPSGVSGGGGSGGEIARSADEYFARMPLHLRPIMEEPHDHSHEEGDHLADDHDHLDFVDDHHDDHDREFVTASVWGNDSLGNSLGGLSGLASVLDVTEDGAGPLSLNSLTTDDETIRFKPLDSRLAALLERLRSLRLEREDLDFASLSHRLEPVKSRLSSLLDLLGGDEEATDGSGLPPIA
jgi:hypothetical protein